MIESRENQEPCILFIAVLLHLYFLYFFLFLSATDFFLNDWHRLTEVILPLNSLSSHPLLSQLPAGPAAHTLGGFPGLLGSDDLFLSQLLLFID